MADARRPEPVHRDRLGQLSSEHCASCAITQFVRFVVVTLSNKDVLDAQSSMCTLSTCGIECLCGAVQLEAGC